MVLHKNNSLITLSFITITILSGLYLSSSSSFAASASTATATVKVAASCTLTTSGGGNYSATVPNGTSAEISGSTLSVSCNDAGGFALYAVGYSNDTVGNNNMIGTNTNISTATSGTNSYWAMKINPTTGNTPTIENSFNNYHIVPDSHTKIASYASSTGSGSLSVDATYKANISSTQLAGNYLGKVKYTLVHPSNEVPPHEVVCEAGKICYNANTNIVEGQMGKQTPTSRELSYGIILWAPNFKKQDYGFVGWSDKYDYETNSNANLYGAQETIDVPTDLSTNGLSLYAVWAPSQGSMQTNSTTVCSSLTQAPIDGTADLSSVSALTDERDNNTYAIAKLADGNCWMIENLRLDNIPELTSANTNNPSLPLKNIYDTNLTSNHLSPTSAVAYDSTTAPEGWCDSHTTACENQSRLRTDNTILYTNNTASNYSTSSNVYGYGNYYNWYSAMAGYTGFNTGNGYTPPGDICPVGWHVPTGGNSPKEFAALDIAMGGNGTDNTNTYSKWKAFPVNVVFAGYVNKDTVYHRGDFSVLNTSTSYGYYYSYSFQLDNSSIYPGLRNTYSFYVGVPVRCMYVIQ